ncbi:peptidoglycan recognition family protein [Massilia sp. IC2-476]|uniref:peptidoglycan recognition protein family protein n=1 Tax=Massilia sp. IC2-476 TaxID=2887199 RepID=UPI001D12DF73|nr:peptidoglycan recognition family protein [Massilia sp. IC2-476]MCC2972962.1 peptidoglycan recognition protein family protein [Massilia sp. IC2-476]
MRPTALSCIAALVLSLSAHAAEPLAAVERGIVPVATWGGTPADAGKAKRHAISQITLHHQGEPFKPGTDPQAYLRRLQSWSRTTKGWLDIPYHYVIDLDGRIYGARRIEFAGDTNTEYDPTGHALIEVVGNFEEVEPNQQQLDAVVDLMALLARKYQVSLDDIKSHRDHSDKTVCPGANLYRYVKEDYFRHKVALRLAGEQANTR